MILFITTFVALNVFVFVNVPAKLLVTFSNSAVPIFLMNIAFLPSSPYVPPVTFAYEVSLELFINVFSICCVYPAALVL